MSTNSLKGVEYVNHSFKGKETISFEKAINSLDKKHLLKYDFINIKHLIIT